MDVSSVFERFTSDDDEEESPGAAGDKWSDYAGFRVGHCPPESDGGWRTVEGFDDMPRPISKEEFRYNVDEELDPGKYRLFGITLEKHLNKEVPPDYDWELFVEPEADGPDEIEALQKEVRALRRQQSQEEQQTQASHQQAMDPDQMDKQLQVQMKMAALNSQEFMRTHGEQVMLSVFGADEADEDGPGFGDYQDHPVGAALYETWDAAMNEPEKLERMGQAVGSGVGSFASGLGQGMQQRRAAADEDGAAAAEGDEEGVEQRDLDAGASSFEELSEHIPEPDEEEVAETAAATAAAEQAAAAAPEPEQPSVDVEEPPEPTGESEAEAEGEARSEPQAAGEQAANGDTETEVVADGMSAGERRRPEGDAGRNAATEEFPAGNGDAAAAEVEQCQAITNAGEQCANRAVDGSQYCHLPDHGPSESSGGGADAGEPTAEEIAEEL